MNKTLVSKAAVITVVGVLVKMSESWPIFAAGYDFLGHATIMAVERAMRMLGQPTYVDGATIHGLGYSVEVVPACVGLVSIAVLASGVALLSKPRPTRALLGLAAVGATALGNVVRIMSILLLGTRDAGIARIAHEVVFPIAITGLFAALWYQWLWHEAAALHTPPEDVSAAPAGAEHKSTA